MVNEGKIKNQTTAEEMRGLSKKRLVAKASVSQSAIHYNESDYLQETKGECPCD